MDNETAFLKAAIFLWGKWVPSGLSHTKQAHHFFYLIGHANCRDVPPLQHWKGEKHTLTVAQCSSALDPYLGSQKPSVTIAPLTHLSRSGAFMPEAGSSVGALALYWLLLNTPVSIKKIRGSLLLLFAKVFPPMHTERNTITLQVKLRAFAQWSRSFLISRVVNQQGERVEQALGKCFLWAALSQTSNPTSRSVVCSR